MKTRRAARAALCTIAATGLVVGISGAGRAAVGDNVVGVSGSAQGLFVAIDIVATGAAADAPDPLLAAEPPAGDDVGAEQFDIEFGPAPSVTLPPEGGGPFADSLADIVVEQSPGLAFTTVGLSEVSTQGALGASGAARSSSTSTRIALSTSFTATAISSECEATSAGATATSTLTDLVFNSIDGPIPLPDDPAPNTVLLPADLPGLGSGVTVTLNKQEIVTDATGTHVVVTAFHVGAVEGTQTARGEVWYGRSECGVVTAPVIEPTFTG